MAILVKNPETFIYVIEVSDDGEVRIKGMSREVFFMAMNTKPDDPYNGVDPIDPTKIRTDVKESDPMYWGDKAVLPIEGKIINLLPVSKVSEWGIQDD